MKLRHGIAIGCLSVLLGMGAFAGVASNQKPVEKAEAATRTYYFVNDKFNWSEVHAYTWEAGNDGNNIGWPGPKLQEITTGVFTVDITNDSYNMIIFNNGNGGGNNQTGNISLSSIDNNLSYYHKSGLWCNGYNLTSGDYLVGSFNGWRPDNDWKLEFDEGNNIAYKRNVTITSSSKNEYKNVEFKARYINFDSETNDVWFSPEDNGHGSFDLIFPNKDCFLWSNEGGNVGIKFAIDGSVTADIAINIKAGNVAYYGLAQPSNVKATIGETTVNMVNSITDLWQLEAAVEGVSNGDSLSFAKISDSSNVEYTRDGTGETDNNYNNIRDNKVILGGDLHVFFHKQESTVWVDGYSHIMEFANGFLSETISQGECAEPSSTLWNKYKDYTLSDNEKSLFAAYVASTSPTKASFADKVEEAAARYLHLLSKYNSLTPFDYAPKPNNLSAPLVTISGGDSTSAVGLVAIIGFTTIIGLGGFFLFKKKKEL